MYRALLILVPLIAAGAAACSSDKVDRSGGHIVVTSPAVLEDTVLATLALEIDVYDGAGDLVDNEMAEVSVVAGGAWLLDANPDTPMQVYSTWTVGGELPIAVQFRSGSGPVSIRIRFFAMELDTILAMLSHPGVAARVSPLPEDTVLIPGGTAHYQVRARDLYGNLRSVPGTVGALDGGIGFDSAAQIATGGAVGRYRLRAAVEGLLDTIEISVVPDFDVAGVAGLNVVRRKIDGSGKQLLFTAPVGVPPVGLTWGGGGTRDILYARSTQPRRIGENGGAETSIDVWALIGSVGNMAASHDSAWVFTDIYYSSSPFVGVARFRPDGSGQAILTPTSNSAQRASPAPDGTRFTYVRGEGGIGVVKIRAIGGNDEAWGVNGQYPHWSPTGGTIAYLDEAGGHVNLLDPEDGSHAVLTPDSVSYTLHRLGWSADGLYVLAMRGNGTWDLIRASDGLILPLWTMRDLSEVVLEP